MKRIAEATNGEYFAAATADQLKRVYENIGSDIGYEKADREVTSALPATVWLSRSSPRLGAISLGGKVAVMVGTPEPAPREWSQTATNPALW